ncbi:MAG TPA: alkaline phosphatase family protein [Pseudonocardiaceae bacterium]|jgi:phosphonoacetate hydrolase
MYLSLTDYIQHKHAPGTEPANALYEQINHYAAQLEQLGAIVILTADHGMSAKTDGAGTAKVVFVEDEVRRILGTAGAEPGSDGLRVILPITDPYTVHHGALGSFASVYLPEGADRDSTIEALRAIEGIQAVYTREQAALTLSLPADRIGDIVVLAEAETAVGRYAEWHDLSGLDAPLRSHGALGELQIPFLVNRVLPSPRRWTSPGDAGHTRGSGARLLKSSIGGRRPGYAEYVARTSGFIPLPPRREQS